MEQYTSVSGVDRITGLENPILRNLQITQSYHALSAKIVQRTGPSANWCTFATWASKQAGQTIRQEDLSKVLDHILLNSEALKGAFAEMATFFLQKRTRLNEFEIFQLAKEALNPVAALEHSGRAVARGNQKVYAEIGREFARFIATCLDDKNYNASQIDRFCEKLLPGEPPNGQAYLRQAFRHCYQAFFESNAKEKAAWMLLANLKIGFHEQTRLQPEIAEALDASLAEPSQFKRRLLGTIFPNRPWVIGAGSFFTRLTGQPTPLDRAIERFFDEARKLIRHVLTENLMTLGFPNGRQIRLGKDLMGEFPPALRQITNPELRAFLVKIDPTTDSLLKTGAWDWANLPDRLHFIADLFRSNHENSDLLMPPFGHEQVEVISKGRIPVDGKL